MSRERPGAGRTAGPAQPSPQRSCGSCQLCCTELGVKELPKAPGVACPHLADSGGCGIWGHHPPTCQTFHCLWRRPEAALPDDMFPEVAGFLLALDQDAVWPTVVKVVSAQARTRAWDTPAHRSVFARLAAAWNCAVVIMEDGRAELAFAPSGRVFEPSSHPEVFPLEGRALALPDADYDADRRAPAERIALAAGRLKTDE